MRLADLLTVGARHCVAELVSVGITLWSYEHDAIIEPYFGCAQHTCHTGPSCLRRAHVSRQRDGANAEGTHAPLQVREEAVLRLCTLTLDLKHLR